MRAEYWYIAYYITSRKETTWEKLGICTYERLQRWLWRILCCDITLCSPLKVRLALWFVLDFCMAKSSTMTSTMLTFNDYMSLYYRRHRWSIGIKMMKCWTFRLGSLCPSSYPRGAEDGFFEEIFPRNWYDATSSVGDDASENRMH
jgi:hypothetical protein